MQNPHDHFELHNYPNGLRLITVPMEHTESVTVLVMVATGSRYEAKEINGISHFLEHMMFKGTTKRPKVSEISLELDSIGAEYNAFTSKEYTGYYVKCAAEKLDTAVDVISDIFLNSKLDAQEIEKEKGVVIEELNMYLDTPTRYVHDIFEELLYGDQPLGWQVVGTKEVLYRLRRDDFKRYFDTHYFDKNTVIAVAGRIETPKTKNLIQNSFAGIRDSNRLEALAVKEAQDRPTLRVFNKKTDQTHYALGFRAFSYFDDRHETANLMSLILGGGMSSRLWQEFREKRGMAYYVRALNETYADSGYFGINAGVDNGRLEEALEVSLGQCRRLAEEKIPEAEIKKAKDYARGKMAISLESSDDLASFYADQELLKHEVMTPEQRLARLEKVTADDVQAVAKEIFRPERLNLALIGPFEENDAAINKIIESW